MIDTDLLLKEIGDIKSAMEKGFGAINTNAATLAGKIDALGGPEGRIMRIEKDMANQTMWTRIHSFAILILPQSIHMGLRALGWMK